MSAGNWSFILVAAGAGNRIGGTPKQFRALGSEPVWKWSARVAEELFALEVISELTVVFPPGPGAPPGEDKFAVPVRYISGGET
jgi:2-C-methyl-D-erythritol 4-phosphate cytidylyltransferase/2-C-methyl-D-erythritol 2,4-cyclodiphosphate synthase